ncbi:beta-galactosidase [Anaerobacterium chartisolvens]|uniref:Beta-galactosidase n=1 Tax=Anaerobacterium chartisolvens TaxID=1297424 RepID=A0A369AU36_9FIRM|nr:beta-galactosidase [Anaerobacterium chartisolvens]RCX12533.1 beta-galactosidase [Anaerobacterium chartisolvens]
MLNPNFPVIYYGGDYNPDQWPEVIWKEDMRMFKAAGINIVTLPVFSWAKLQPSEEVYDFEWLDKVMDLVAQNEIKVCLATSTAAQPAWMSKKYPDILPVDINGHKRAHGGRVNFCPNSSVYRRFSTALAKKLAERYKDYPGLAVWHIANEYGNYCYCENCAASFRAWVKQRYGTIEEVNRRWNMSFWGHTIYDWDEIVAPSHLNEMWLDNGRQCTNFQGIALDYNRFMSDSSLQCYKAEYEAIKEITPDIPVTTNLMGTFKPLDYFKWARCMDVVSWDNYPSAVEPVSNVAMRHDLMRGLKDGQPFMLMEQTPSQQNWQQYNSLKRPGVMRLWSYQAVAHGADSVMFFQLRRSFGACEKYHGAVIAHAGHENTRVFNECAKLGAELKALGDKLIGSTARSKAAIMFDWDNWWAVEFSSGPSIRLKYLEQVEKYYRCLHSMNISIDMIGIESDLSAYEVVIAPVLYMVKPGTAKRLESFVEAGGVFITTFFSGIVNENDLVTLGGYPGELRKLLGIWVEEIDALFPEAKNSIVIKEELGTMKGTYSCGMLCDLMHLEGARELAVYGSDFYAGRPALTENLYGDGRAYYIASDPEEDFLKDFIGYICGAGDIGAALDVPENVELTQRFKENKEFTFVLNHNDFAVDINLGSGCFSELITGKTAQIMLSIEPKGVAILEREI